MYPIIIISIRIKPKIMSQIHFIVFIVEEMCKWLKGKLISWIRFYRILEVCLGYLFRSLGFSFWASINIASKQMWAKIHLILTLMERSFRKEISLLLSMSSTLFLNGWEKFAAENSNGKIPRRWPELWKKLKSFWMSRSFLKDCNIYRESSTNTLGKSFWVWWPLLSMIVYKKLSRKGWSCNTTIWLFNTNQQPVLKMPSSKK